MWDMSEEFAGAVNSAPATSVVDIANHKPGIYYGVANDDYHAIDAINNSMLSLAHNSVSDYMQYRRADKDKEKLKVFDFGSAAHTALLEPDRFASEYIVKPYFNLRTNKGKADSHAWDVEHSDCPYIITEAESRQLKYMVNSTLADPRAAHWLNQPGNSEVTVIWRDNATGLLCKLKADRLIETPELIVCLDFKSTETITKFQKDFFNLRYDVQDHHYTTGLMAHFGKPVLFLFIACAKHIELGRYPTMVTAVHEDDKDIAATIWRSDMNKVAQAITLDDWIEYGTIKRTNAQREYYYEKYRSE